MGLNFILFDLGGPEPILDDRFDSLWHAEDIALSLWLDDGNSLYRYFGDPHQLDAFRRTLDFPVARRWIEEHLASEEERAREFDLLEIVQSPERFAQLSAGMVTAIRLGELWTGMTYVRPKDFAAARAWVQTVDIPYAPVRWDRKRFLDLLDLLKRNNDLWLYRSV